MIIIVSALVYCLYGSYKKITENKISENKNEILAKNIKNFIGTVKEIITNVDISDYQADTKSKIIKNFLINYLTTLEEYPYSIDFESSESVSPNEELNSILSNIELVLDSYSKIDWRHLISLKSNNYYYLTKLNLLDDIKSFMNILNTEQSSQELNLDYHYI